MGWGPVTSIGTAERSSGTTLTLTSCAIVPAGALIVVGVTDANSAAILSSQLSDNAGNSYTLGLSTTSTGIAALAAFFSTNANGLSTSNTITYNVNGSGSFGSALTAAYSSNSLGFQISSAVTQTAHGTGTSPTVTSNVPLAGGSLFIGFASQESIVASFSQDSVHGWAFPPNDAGGLSGIGDIIGGNKVSPAVPVAQTYAPTSTGSALWQVGIIAFQEANVLSFYRDLSLPTLPRQLPIHVRFDTSNRGFPTPLLYFPPLSELPARVLPSLRGVAPPFMALQINYVQYNFSLVEAFDAATITINTFTNINAAQVTITEIQSQTTQVTIQELKFTPGYS